MNTVSIPLNLPSVSLLEQHNLPSCQSIYTEFRADMAELKERTQQQGDRISQLKTVYVKQQYYPYLVFISKPQMLLEL